MLDKILFYLRVKYLRRALLLGIYQQFKATFFMLSYPKRYYPTSMGSVANVNDAASSGSNCEIEPRLYKAATKGNIEPFKEINQNDLHLMVTPIKNTILHIYMTSLNQTPKSTEFVKQILEICPSVLLQVNANGDTPLHVAARFGYPGIVEVLIECAKSRHEEVESGLEPLKQMLRMTNNEGNTALHEAVRSASLDVVEILTKEDPEFSYSANHCKETPLFMAAAGQHFKIVVEILETCKSAAHGGPHGKTALHAAVMSGDLDSFIKIFEKNKILTKVADQHGWTPLHYAAYYGRSSIAQQLVESDKSAAYTADKDRKMTALHLAAGQGYEGIMEAIISHCPDCCEMVDNKGWNFLHFAMISLSVDRLTSFLTKSLVHKCLLRSLLNRKDLNGNTPIHVLAAGRPVSYRKIIKMFEGPLATYKEPNGRSIFKTTRSEDILSYGSPLLKLELKELSEVVDIEPYRRGIIGGFIKWNNQIVTIVEKAKESHLVVVALIATVTFAAVFTMPDDYKNEGGIDEGTTILTKRTAFQAFVITDALSFIFSLTALFCHFLIALQISDFEMLFQFAFGATYYAMLAMMLAFVTGTYVVLTPSLGLAIANCIIGLSFFLTSIALFWM